MNRKLLALGLLLSLSQMVWSQDGTALLAQMDKNRQILDMTFLMDIQSFDGEKLRESSTIQGFVKIGTSANRVLLHFTQPAAAKGRKMLMEGNYAYVLFPKTRNPIRLSPLQVLMGESSNGDVARTGFSQDYDVEALDQARVLDKDCWVFTLKVKESRKDASYQKIRLSVEKTTMRPLYGEFMGGGDKLLKKAFYRDYKTMAGKDLASILDIYDPETPQKHTVLTYKSVGQKVLPDSAFRREYLETWAPAP